MNLNVKSKKLLQFVPFDNAITSGLEPDLSEPELHRFFGSTKMMQLLAAPASQHCFILCFFLYDIIC
jgi:hypothetical protein